MCRDYGVGLTALLTASVILGSGQSLPSQAPPPSNQSPTGVGRPGPPLVPLDEAWLRWPLAPSEQAYAVIDGRRLRGYVEELAAIGRRSRDRGEQWWGRIIGRQADAETELWLMDRFRKAGVPEVRSQTFDLPPQWYPSSWAVTASANGTTLPLESAMPGNRAPSTPPSGLDLEAVYVGLGTEADFSGREVKGRAVFIHAIPYPGLWSSSAVPDRALDRAQTKGAAAVFLAVGLPGNLKMHAVRGGGGLTIPAFSIGSDDLVRVRRMIEAAPGGGAPRVKIHLASQMIAGLKTATVWGVIPGTTDEKVIVAAHRDGFFEGAADNASGVATLVGLAEYFAGLPKEKRRRTIMLAGTPGHHGTPDLGFKWIQDNKDTDLGGNVALFINGEHTAAGQTYLRGPVIRKANAANAFWWSLEGSHKLQDIVLNAYRTFGVATYAEPEAGSPPGANGDYGDIPTLGLVDASHLYHTEAETADTIPPSGLEAATRAFAKIIDEADKLTRTDLLKVQPRRPGL